MGEAKRKRDNAIVYHHTSVLVTNRIWMAGVLKPDGPVSALIPHPKISTGVIVGGKEGMRRACEDFPPLVWFTTRIAIPKCLMSSAITLCYPNRLPDDKIAQIQSAMAALAATVTPSEVSNFNAWNRVALGFRAADIPVVRWRDYYGYNTQEGRTLNESAIEDGDDPTDWYVSEVDIDVMKVREYWASASVYKPRLKRIDAFVPKIMRMVSLCREAHAYIPPSWMKLEDMSIADLTAETGIPVIDI